MTEYRTNRTDRELVAAHLSGDPAAFAAIYERFADSLYDTARAMLSDSHDAEDLAHDVFVVAAKRLDQLRDPDRLRPWLFAILRHEVYRRSKQRKRTRATAFDGSTVPEMVAPDDPRAEAAEVEVTEVAAFVREAAAGLTERDQLVLELSARQGLAGADLADALGVTQQQCHVLVHRMRERVQRSLGALTVARYGRRDCPALQALLQAWDGTFEPRIRKRVAGHIDDCDVCEATSRKFAVIPLFGAAPAFAAPTGLRDRVLASTAGVFPGGEPGDGYRFDESGGFPGAERGVGRLVVAAALVTVVLLLLGGTWFALASGDDESDVAASTPAGPTTVTAAASTEPPSATAGTTSTSSTVGTGSSTSSTSATTSTSTSTTTSTTTASTTTTSILVVALPTTSTTTTSVPATTTTPSPATTTTAAVPTTTTTTTVRQPGQLVLSASTLDLGATAPQAVLSVANTGDLPLDWTIGGSANPFIWSSTAGTLAPGATTDVPVAIDRTGLAEGDIVRNFTVSSSAAGTTALTVRAAVEHDPVVQFITGPSMMLCPGPSGSPVLVSVTDESAVTGVELIWTGPGPTGSTAMFSAGSSWEGILDPDPIDGNWTWEARATDARGNVGSITVPFIVSGC